MKPKWVVDPGWTGDWELPAALLRPLDDVERRILVTLSCGGMGPRRLASEVSTASLHELLGRFPLTDYASRVMSRLDACGARVVTPGDAEYPLELREIAAPPPLLYVRGSRLDATAPRVAIVGARVCTHGAGRFARRLAGELADAGFCVVSGLARGIDAHAHTGALEAGSSVAVLGTGIDRTYPREHDELAALITASGAVVSEFPPGVGPRQWHFPARNRIVSGLSIAVVVVEAGERSGALITAGYALHQGREVFACVTGPENPAGAGVREMLRDGANMIVDAGDAVDELVDLASRQGYELPGRDTDGRSSGPVLDGDAALVFGAVLESSTVEDVVAATGLRASRVATVLSELELDGVVASPGGGRWSRAGFA